MSRFYRIPAIVFLTLAFAASAKSEVVLQPHIEVELVSDVASVGPNADFSVAFRIRPDSKWHVYWENPGASGEPLKAAWTLPKEVQVGELRLPVPERLPVGSLVNYGYGEEILWIAPAKNRKADGSVDLRAKLSWLVCQDICIPGHADLSISLPVASESKPSAWKERFDEARKKLPETSSAIATSLRADGDGVWVLGLSGLPVAATEVKSAYFFPRDPNWIEASARQSFAIENIGLSIRAKKAALDTPVVTRSGVLRLDTDRGVRGFEIDFAPAGGGTGAAAQAILFALLGGIILNLMPCVFPVLCIKVLNFAETANQGSKKAWGHAAAYTGGILISFWALAGTLITLRAGGQQLGWGFQLQSPLFLAVICLLLLGMSLNLLGAFEIEGAWSGAGQHLAARKGYGGSFFSGMLATIVATPCTAPFMGTAVAFALTQPGWIAWSIFTSLGLGLAIPYVLLSVFPAAARLLPRPGAWMITLKQAMAFPLLATVVWLVWVFGLQTSTDTVALLLGCLLQFSFVLWAYGRTRRYPWLRLVVVVLVATGSMFWLSKNLTKAVAEPGATSGQWKPFTRTALDEALASGKPVFVDFTAAWCITCKINERVAIEVDSVRKKFEEKHVTLLKADWTNQNEEISRELEKHGRNGVPLYLLYSAGGEPTILPQLLTPDLVIQALDKI